MSSAARDMALLRERDPGFRCAYCATPLALPLPQVGGRHLEWEYDGWELWVSFDDEPSWVLLDGYAFAHRDHIVPSSRGGSNDLDNLVLACDVCNMEKKARPLLLFLAIRAGCPRYRSVGGDHAQALAKAWCAA